MIDIEKLAAKYPLDLRHKREGWVQMPCPFCGNEGSHGGWYLGFSLTSGAFNCWRCGVLKFWTVMEAITSLRGPELSHLVRELQIGERDAVPRAAPKARKRSIRPPGKAGALWPRHEQYLRQRGFNPDELVREWGLLGTTVALNGWSWRVVLPVKNEDGDIVAYQGRSIGTAQPKYKMTNDEDCLEDPDSFVYGIDKAKGDSVLIVEGGPGVWRMGPGTVGTFGIDWKHPQANRLRKFKNRFIFFDPEPQAQKKAQELAEYLSLYPGNTEILTGFATDPGEFSVRRALRLREQLGL